MTLPIASMPNLRDLGGHATPDGRVSTGLPYRSVSLAHLADADVDAFGRLGVRSVFDLRTATERTEEPNRVLPTLVYVDLDVLADNDDAGPAHLRAVLSDPAAAAAYLGDGQAARRFVDGYREFVTLPSARAAYRSFFTTIADDAQRPALFHCTAGKDRTGWAAATLLLLLGVADDDVMRDYLRTNEDLVPMYAPALEHEHLSGLGAKG